MKARIYRPSKTAMQSGRARTHDWVLECESDSAQSPEFLMGWSKTDDTCNQIKMKFESLEDAIAFAQNRGLEYTVQAMQERHMKPRNYAYNFRYIPADDQESA